MATTSLSAAAAATAGEDRVLATAQQILRSLNTPEEVRQDMLLIFSSFDNRLSAISDLVDGANDDSKSSSSEDNDEGSDDSDEDLGRLEAAERVILRWDSSLFGGGDPSRHSASLLDSPDDAAEYFSAVDEIIQWMESLKMAAPPTPPQRHLTMADRAENAIQIAMARLEDELRHALIRSTVPLDADSLYGSMRRASLSFASHDGGGGSGSFSIDRKSSESFGEASLRFHESDASFEEDCFFVDLVHPDAVLELRDIVDRMVRSGYERECLHVYSSVRRDAFEECLVILGVERLSIEEVHRVEWTVLDEKMKNWVHAVKIGVGVLLTGEKRLCESVFGELEQVKDVCFNEIAKNCVMQLLNFGEAVAICKRSPEKLFRILDMYEALRDALPDLQAMVSDEFLIGEARGVLSGLGLAAVATFAEFENRIRNETSKKPVVNGDVHPLVRYVMNYLKLLVDFDDPLNSLLDVREDDLYRFVHDFGGDGSQLAAMTPLGQRTLLLMSELEHNLEEKSRVYEDSALQHVFLMNNLHYLVRKVKDSDLGKVLGDDWIRKRRGQIRQHATGYLRASWSKSLDCLKDHGIGGSSSSISSASKMALKERFKNFNACFEEIYRVQTAWKVADDQLREELRISISEKAIPAYRSFVGRFSPHLEGKHAGKYIKYAPDDIENYLLDLFEGSPAVLHHRKST